MMKASASSRFRISTAAMNDMPWTCDTQNRVGPGRDTQSPSEPIRFQRADLRSRCRVGSRCRLPARCAAGRGTARPADRTQTGQSEPGPAAPLQVRYLLEYEERREGSGDVQLDEVQTGLPVRQRRSSVCRETEQTGMRRPADPGQNRTFRTRTGTALVVVDRARLAVAPPLLLGSGQEDLIQFYRDNQNRALETQNQRGANRTQSQNRVGTCCDVELVADGQAPDSSSDSRRKALPPEVPDPPRPLPEHTHRVSC